MADAHKNFAYSAVAVAPSPATSGTSLVVTTDDGTKFPTAPFNAIVWPSGFIPSTTNAEIVRVTAVSTDTLTITRTQESTTARTIVAGDQISAGITAKTLTDVEGAGGGQTLVTKVVASAGGDYTTLSSAIAAASAGWTIYVKAGTYTETGITGLALANISIVGDNPEATVLTFGANSFTTASGADYLHITGVKFTFTTGKLSLANCTSPKIINCHFSKTGNGNGFEAQSSATEMLFAHNYYDSTSTDTASVSFLVISNYGRIIGNTFRTNATFTARGHIELDGNGLIVSNNNFEYNGTGTQYLVKMKSAPGVFSNNTIVQTTSALLAHLQITGDYLAVSGCVISATGVGGTGILVQSSGVTISGNHFKGGASSTGINVNTSTNTSITGNTFVTHATGITVGSSSSDIAISNNNFYAYSADGIINAGAGTTITSNKFSTFNSAGNGITINAGNCTVSANNVTGGSSAGTGLGISVSNAVANDDNIITGNRVSAFLTGIKVVGANSDRTLITSNNTQGNGTGLTDSGTTSTLANNV